MKVLSFNLGSDPAGISVGIARAFRGDAEWEVRSLISQPNYIEYPADVPFDRATVADHWEWADLLHVHHNFASVERMRRGYAQRRVRPKPYVVEFHGTQFREQTVYHLSEMRRYEAVGLVSTLDLFLLAPNEVEWLPCPIEVDRLVNERTGAIERKDESRIVIAHAPTNREIKSTEDFLAAVRRLQDEGFPVELELIERVTWDECLRRKARADIFFDQVILGYGNNALEAWAMGIPVVAGASDETLDEMERRFGHLPFYHATEDTIYDALRELVESPELRAEYGRIGHEYVRKYHDEPVVVEQLKGIYRRALGMQEEEAA